ncbi:MAG TPA: dihydrolipoamide acetyltransferase family protein [Gemmatimonadales bacterium]|jgi:pyruvate dehydrogenase E2 component (dihydrolipoamide acetyltransferase)|nr:dihydrolipoamide acetyltransferase family protein [Gemmatimonadales bacterium]
MPTNVVMEALSPTMEEGRLVEWKKQEGDPVAVGDVLAEVETDKAVMELVARTSGTLLKHVVEAGATVPVSEPVAVIGQPGEAVSGEPGTRGSANGQRGTAPDGRQAAPQAAKPKPTQGTQPSPDRKQATSMPPAPPAPAAAEGRPAAAPGQRPASAPAASTAPALGTRVKASPLARRMAAERGLNLGSIAGSGPEGRIIARDLEEAGAVSGTTAASPPAATAPAPRRTPSESFTDVPLTQIRKTIAKRLVQSIGPIPTFYLTSEADMERMWEAREALRAAGERETPAAGQQVKVSFNDILIKAVALALRQHPACNAWWQDDHIRYWNDIHISMAVAVEEGLITPVIRFADLKSLREIALEARDLASRARERKLRPEEYTGGTFSISNLGMLDIDEFTAVINPPEAGILAVGRIAEKAVVHDGAIAPRRRMRFTMSCDHRVIDGATGAQFLKTLKGMLENPLALVW